MKKIDAVPGQSLHGSFVVGSRGQRDRARPVIHALVTLIRLINNVLKLRDDESRRCYKRTANLCRSATPPCLCVPTRVAVNVCGVAKVFELFLSTNVSPVSYPRASTTSVCARCSFYAYVFLLLAAVAKWKFLRLSLRDILEFQRRW